MNKHEIGKAAYDWWKAEEQARRAIDKSALLAAKLIKLKAEFYIAKKVELHQGRLNDSNKRKRALQEMKKV